MHPRRLERLSELILQTVSQCIFNLKDPGLGFVTVTGAKLTPDVSLIRVYYSVLGTEAEKQATAEALERAKPWVRREIGQLENLRRVPDIAFTYDESVERADRVNRLLNTIQQEKEKEGPKE